MRKSLHINSLYSTNLLLNNALSHTDEGQLAISNFVSGLESVHSSNVLLSHANGKVLNKEFFAWNNCKLFWQMSRNPYETALQKRKKKTSEICVLTYMNIPLHTYWR